MTGKRPQKHRSCTTKRSFRSAGAARAAMKAARRNAVTDGDLAVYPCRFCGGWHWGHADGAGSAMSRTVRAIDRALARDAELKSKRKDDAE